MDIPESLLEHYSCGMCHLFAISNVRRYGGSFLVVENYDQMHRETVEGEPGRPEVHHVFSVHETPTGHIIRDVHGDYDYDHASDIVFERYGYFSMELQPVQDEGLLSKLYISSGPEQHKQLKELSSKALSVAMADIDEWTTCPSPQGVCKQDNLCFPA